MFVNSEFHSVRINVNNRKPLYLPNFIKKIATKYYQIPLPTFGTFAQPRDLENFDGPLGRNLRQVCNVAILQRARK